MVKEILACVTEKNIKYLESGQISKVVFPMERQKAHKQKVIHLITRLFIVSQSPKGEIQYLVQKRGKKKISYPEYFTDSSSGHVIWKKDLNLKKIQQDAIRELEEEFGIPASALQKVKFYELNDAIYKAEREMSYIFLGLVDFQVDLKPNPEEVDIEASKFYNRAELENILKNEKLIEYPRQIWNMLLNADINSLFKIKSTPKPAENKNIALFIGRFQPLHHGHIYVLRNILKSYKIVKIGIGSSQLSNTVNDPFTNNERKEFINAALKKRGVATNQYKIYDIPDIFNAKKWVDHVVSIVGEFDAVFSNSDWIRELFQNKGFKVEKKIEIFKKKFNSSNIRKLIIKNNKSWRPLAPQEVVQLIEKYNGIDRIQSLKSTENS